jgi:hypothetical protein
VERPTEKVLDKVLEEGLKFNKVFADWFLSQTKFAGSGAILHWSRADHPRGSHPHEIIDPATGESRTTQVESETDVLVVFTRPNSTRFALHIENKLAGGSFTPQQPERYRSRACFWLGNPKYCSYSDFETVLIAPQTFFDDNPAEAKKFDRYISHEQIAAHLPSFRPVLERSRFDNTNDNTIVTKPQCHACQHWRKGSLACKAFPDEIPDLMLTNAVLHDRSFPGDGGIIFLAK